MAAAAPTAIALSAIGGGSLLAVIVIGIVDLWASRTVLSLTLDGIELREAWKARRLIGRPGDRVVRLPAPGDPETVAALLWVDRDGSSRWITQGYRWPLDEVEELAAAAGLAVEDGSPADLAGDG